MSLTLLTQDFTLLLEAAKLTAYAKPNEDAILSGVYLYTTEGESGEDVGSGTLLVAVGYDGATVGQLAVPTTGTLPHPILIPNQYTSWLSSMCNAAKTAANKTDKDAEHTVELTVSGQQLVVKTLSDGFPADYDVNGTTPLLDASQYPAREAGNRLATKGIVDGIPTDADFLVTLEDGKLSALKGKAAKTFKTSIRSFPRPGNGGTFVMTDGLRWRAVTSVEPYEGSTDGIADVDAIPVTEPKSAPESVKFEPTPTDDAE